MIFMESLGINYFLNPSLDISARFGTEWSPILDSSFSDVCWSLSTLFIHKFFII